MPAIQLFPHQSWRGNRTCNFGENGHAKVGKNYLQFWGKTSCKKQGLATMFKLNIRLEESAIQHYRQLILKVVDDQDLTKMLLYNMVDEDSHKKWFSSELEKITDK